MKKEKKKWHKVNFFVPKLSAFVITIGGIATITSCTALFHEKEIPNEILKNHPFLNN